MLSKGPARMRRAHTDNSDKQRKCIGLISFLTCAVKWSHRYKLQWLVPFALLILGSSHLDFVYSFLDSYFEVHQNFKKMPLGQKICR